MIPDSIHKHLQLKYKNINYCTPYCFPKHSHPVVGRPRSQGNDKIPEMPGKTLDDKVEPCSSLHALSTGSSKQI